MSPSDGSVAALRVALVEDDTRTRRVMATLLEDEGWTVEAFDRAEAALERVQRGGIEALITDHILPGMKGLELVLNARSVSPTLRCVVISGTSPLDDAVVKNVRWITKPVNFDALVAEISGRTTSANTQR